MATGTVKWFNDAKGYGFITPDDGGGKDLFVHHTAISGDGYKSLPEGAKVEYEAAEGAQGPEAKNVVQVAGYGERARAADRGARRLLAERTRYARADALVQRGQGLRIHHDRRRRAARGLGQRVCEGREARGALCAQGGHVRGRRQRGRASGAERHLRAGGRCSTREDAQRRARNSTLGGLDGDKEAAADHQQAQPRARDRGEAHAQAAGQGREARGDQERRAREAGLARPAERAARRRRSRSGRPAARAIRLRWRPGPSSWKLARRTGSTRRVAASRGWGSTARLPGR